MARGYAVAFGLALGIAVSNGLARFAYALILPAMQADLGWSYTEAGSLNTVNAAGYLAGSLLAFATLGRLGARSTFIGGLWLTVLAMLATAVSRDFVVLAILRALAGLSAAYVLIAGSVLAASVFPTDPRRAASAIAIYFGGGGAGLLLAGAAIPPLLAEHGDQAWPQAWLLLGAIGGVASIAAMAAAWPVVTAVPQAGRGTWRKRAFWPLFAAYGCFALGYFAYMTFIVAWMRSKGATPTEIMLCWSVLGLANLLSPHIWGRALAHWRGGRAMAVVLLTIAIGAALPLADAALPVMLASAALFGSFFMVPASVTAHVKRTLPADVWGEAIAAFTLVFALLQCAGPVLTGALADLTGDLRLGLGLSALVLLLGAGFAWMQQDPS